MDYKLTSALRLSQKADYAVWNDIFNNNIKEDIFIYGSSRAWVQFNPKILEDSLGLSVYNFGMDGYRFKMQYYRHLLLLKYSKQPKCIIHSLDFNTFEKQTELYNAKQFLPYIRNEEIRIATRYYKGFDIYDYNLPYVRYHGQSQAIYHGLGILLLPSSNSKDRYKGFQAQNREWNDDLANAKLANSSYNVVIDDAIVSLFESYIQDLKNKNIQLILVYSPEYKEGQQYVRNRNSVMLLYKNIARKYNVPLIDYTDSSICGDKSKYYNSMHLNKIGSNIFSKQLAHSLKYNYLANHE